jgi:hypothetical protein
MVSKLSEWLYAAIDARLTRELRVDEGGIAADHAVATGSLGDVEGLVGGLH